MWTTQNLKCDMQMHVISNHRCELMHVLVTVSTENAEVLPSKMLQHLPLAL